MNIDVYSVFTPTFHPLELTDENSRTSLSIPFLFSIKLAFPLGVCTTPPLLNPLLTLDSIFGPSNPSPTSYFPSYASVEPTPALCRIEPQDRQKTNPSRMIYSLSDCFPRTNLPIPASSHVGNSLTINARRLKKMQPKKSKILVHSFFSPLVLVILSPSKSTQALLHTLSLTTRDPDLDARPFLQFR